MNPDIIFLATGGILLFLGISHELQWRLRSRNSEIHVGRVVDIRNDGDGGYYPLIEYTFEGNTTRFQTAYSTLPTPFVGDEVPILVDVERRSAEIYTAQTRWMFSSIAIAAGLCFLAAGSVLAL